MSYLRLVIWDLVPNEIKESESHNALKFKIKGWVPEGYQSRTWKVYLGEVGFRQYKKSISSAVKLKYYHYYHCI